MRSASAPLIERNPLLFWKGLSLVLGCAALALLAAAHLSNSSPPLGGEVR